MEVSLLVICPSLLSTDRIHISQFVGHLSKFIEKSTSAVLTFHEISQKGSTLGALFESQLSLISCIVIDYEIISMIIMEIDFGIISVIII